MVSLPRKPSNNTSRGKAESQVEVDVGMLQEINIDICVSDPADLSYLVTSGNLASIILVSV